MSKLEEDAAAFKRKKCEAEKKARQRAGIIKVYVGVTPAMAQWLFDEGLLPKCKRKDPATIAKAIEEHLSRRSARVRGHTSWRDRWATTLTPAEEAERTASTEEYVESVRAQDRAEGINPDYCPRILERSSGRSGVNGRNPGCLNTLTVFNARGVQIGRVRPGGGVSFKGERIKPLSGGELKKLVAPIERIHGKLTLPNKGDIFTAAKKSGADVNHTLDRMVAEAEGHVRKVNTSDNWRLGGDDKNDKGSES